MSLGIHFEKDCSDVLSTFLQRILDNYLQINKKIKLVVLYWTIINWLSFKALQCYKFQVNCQDLWTFELLRLWRKSNLSLDCVISLVRFLLYSFISLYSGGVSSLKYAIFDFKISIYIFLNIIKFFFVLHNVLVDIVSYNFLLQ